MNRRSVEPGDRYAVQERVRQIGPSGQARLGEGRAVVVGVGALGSAISQQLVRAGLGMVVLVDSDRIELGNLHRQVLYTEADVADRRSKVEAAAAHLRECNSLVDIETVDGRLTRENADQMIQGAHVVVDGTDNLASRHVINDACLRAEIPWIYGGVAGTHGLILPIFPGRGPCLRCLFEDPPTDELSTAATVGVFGPAPAVIGALQAAMALRVVTGDLPLSTKLLSIDVWTGEIDAFEVKRSPDCPACSHLR
ncbi:MAG: HesA/MoeB/ThiF family protein [Gammaproteobacteria bacterium]|nr:HesA/MoeB/ThiF family protein [Gammaproteobacteria bacterium]